jgi:hypothetical protein
MLSFFVCLIFGHCEKRVLEKVVHPPVRGYDFEGASNSELFILTLSGYTAISLICPRCKRVQVVRQ